MPTSRPHSSRCLVATLIAVGFAAAGCALSEVEDGGVGIRTDGAHVHVTNDTPDRIYYFVVGRELSTLIDWVPHLNEDQSVAPRRTHSIPYSEIPMQGAETEAVFYWWIADMRDGERVPGDLQSRVIDL